LDDILKSSLECFLNTELDDETWNQTSLPISLGGIGIRKLRDIAIPAYCASIYSTNELANSIISSSIIVNNIYLDEAELSWKNSTNLDEIPSIPSVQKKIGIHR